jgi:hypothetical protein
VGGADSSVGGIDASSVATIVGVAFAPQETMSMDRTINTDITSHVFLLLTILHPPFHYF